MHITHLAQGPTRSRIAFHHCAPEESLVIWCVACLILCCSLTCRLQRYHHLPYSLFLLPRHKNTQHNRYNMINSESTQYITHISKLSQSTSCAIKNHSGGKTCRVAETRERQLPQKAGLRRGLDLLVSGELEDSAGGSMKGE